MENKIITLEALPVIKYHLEQLSIDIKEKVDKANKLIVNEDTVKDIKKVRADLNKEFNELEVQRKEIKNAILEKYNEFEEIYKTNVSNLYKDADNDLKEKIDSVESQLRNEKEVELRTFFNEYQESLHLDFAKFEDIGLNITLSASMKHLKEQIKDFCERISKDIKLIEKDEESDQLMLEYQNNGYDYQDAKLRVIERKQLLEKMQQQREKQEEVKKQEEKVVEIVQEIVAPKEIIEDDQLLEVNFTIKATKEKIKLLKQFLKENEIEVI